MTDTDFVLLMMSIFWFVTPVLIIGWLVYVHLPEDSAAKKYKEAEAKKL